MMPRPVWFCGSFVEDGELRISSDSLTLTQGLGAYETLRVVGGRAPWIDLHAERLRAACREMGLAGAEHDWAAIVAELSARCRLPDARARITVGAGFVLVTCGPLPAELEREQSEGVALVTAALARELPALKCVSRAALLLAERRAGGEVLLCDAAGRPLETSRANVFVWWQSRLFTAPDPTVLPGIGRRIALACAADLGLTVVFEPAPRSALDAGAELLLTNAVRGVRPAARLDDRALPIGDGTRRLQAAVQRRWGL